MERSTTIKDIAARSGYSFSTVHLVLAGKPGPKEETRREILELARDMNYRRNLAASSMKRGTIKIAVILPAPTDVNLSYYAPVWQGVRDCFHNVRDFDLEVVEFPYVGRELVWVTADQVQLARDTPGLSGVLALGNMEQAAQEKLKRMSDEGIPNALVISDAPNTGRICCVQVEHYLLGRVMGEILAARTPAGSGLLVCAGEPNIPADRETTRGIKDYFQEHDPSRILYQEYYDYDNDMKQYQERLSGDLLAHEDITGCCSVTARGSVSLGRALVDTGKDGTLIAIGSDVFPENLERLKRGVFQNLIFKNPYQQGWQAAERLFHYIVDNIPPNRDAILVKGEVVFQSMISMYEALMTT